MLAMKGQTISLPVGDTFADVKIGEAVKVSLRTHEAREAKERFIAANAALQAYWQAVEQGPRKLTHREAVAVSEDVYRLWADQFADDPKKPEVWQRILAMNEEAERGEYGRAKLMIGPEAKEAASLEARVGYMADMVLRQRGWVVDDASRKTVMKECLRSASQAAGLNLRRAKGDYRADPDADRFPKLDKPKAAHTRLTMSAMVATWEKEALRLGRAPATVSAYKSVFDNFRKFMGKDDAGAVTKEDIVRYKDKLFDDGLQAKTIKDRHLAALKSVFGHAVENGRLTINPVADIKLRTVKRKTTREPGFTDKEALVILKAANGYERTGKESPYLAVAKRWVPWLSAFTGARVTDLTSLKKEDFRLSEADPQVRIFDNKTGKYRDIPLHPQLQAIGLLDFVRLAKAGPLFYDETTDKGKGAESQSGKLSKWVRSLGITDDVQPNHGWRHRFTTLARLHGMDHEKREFIVGHNLPGLGSTYGSMAGLRQEIEKLPFYEI